MPAARHTVALDTPQLRRRWAEESRLIEDDITVGTRQRRRLLWWLGLVVLLLAWALAAGWVVACG